MTIEKLKKYDDEKLDLTLAPSCLSRHYCSVSSFGAKKYGRNNWKKTTVEEVRKHYASMLRHQDAEMRGEQFDPESGLLHGWHALVNRTFVNYFIEKYGFKEVMKHIGEIDE